MTSRRAFLTRLALLTAGGAALWSVRDRLPWPPLEPRFANGRDTPWQTLPPRGGLIEIAVTVDGHPIRAAVDSGAQLSVSVTGVAGPGGGSAEKPVGLVHFGAARAGFEPITEHHIFPGDRDGIRRLTVITALAMLAKLAER